MNMEHFFPNKEQFDTMNGLLAVIAGSSSGKISVDSWKAVQSIVRKGMADKVFSIGDQLVCKRGEAELVWDIIGFDHDVPANGAYTHSMTLQLHDVFSDLIEFDAEEALYYHVNPKNEDGTENNTPLAVGKYCFKLSDGYDEKNGGGQYYSFTLSSPVPVGGVIMFQWAHETNASTAMIYTYEDKTKTEPIESTSVTKGNVGTELTVNLAPRLRSGSNDWAESAVRQFLNGNREKGNWWAPQTDFDMPLAKCSSLDGFLYGIDEDFLAVVGAVVKTTHVPSYTGSSGGGTNKQSHDRFFLLSRSEVYAEESQNEGAPYEYYRLASENDKATTGKDSGRIKYRNGSRQAQWLRSGPVGATYSAHSVAMSGPSGMVEFRAATADGIGVAPACNIV